MKTRTNNADKGCKISKIEEATAVKLNLTTMTAGPT